MTTYYVCNSGTTALFNYLCKIMEFPRYTGRWFNLNRRFGSAHPHSFWGRIPRPDNSPRTILAKCEHAKRVSLPCYLLHFESKQLIVVDHSKRSFTNALVLQITLHSQRILINRPFWLHPLVCWEQYWINLVKQRKCFHQWILLYR